MLTLLIMTYGGLMHNFGRTKKHRMAMHQYLEVHNIQARKHSVKLAKCYQNLYPIGYRNLQSHGYKVVCRMQKGDENWSELEW